MKKRIKYFIIPLVTVLMCLSLTLPFLNIFSVSPTLADYFYTILDSGMFTEEVDVDAGDAVSNHTLNCYRIKNYDTFIAVSWGESSASSPTTINIPQTITSNKPTGENVDYTVVAVARAGFSHCNSSTITIPQTVKDIREEAFAYCQELTSFQIPQDVTQIAPSTFLDCRKLVSLYYSNESGKKTLNNDKITSFGDHAFDSCVSLKKVQCPNSATFFGQSCFQKCSTLSVFRFPLDNEAESDDDRNFITVEDYAFADCLSLQRVYFDINMLHISDYAFADSKSDLTFYFYDSQANFPSSLSSLWRNKKITFGNDGVTDYSTLVYNINYDIEKPLDGGYPGLTVSLSKNERKLDNARGDKETGNTSQITVVPASEEEYAIITRFVPPDQDEQMEGYYKDGVLTIPDSVTVGNKSYPVKVLGPGACGENDEITEVHFNQHLVQICNKAFWHSNNIEVLNFNECEDLVEISYSLFNDIITTAGKEEDAVNGDVQANATIADANSNAKLTSLTLPNCLEYIGNFAFFNFTRLTKGLSFKTNPNQPSKLKIIGDYAFAVYSASNYHDSYLPSGVKPEIDLVLPNSLDDSYAPLANIYHSFSFDRKGGTTGNATVNYPTVNASIWNRVAINKNAFDNQDGIRTVTMEKGGTAHNISFGSNVFVRNSGIARFEASDNLCLIGNETFKTCANLKEVFLVTDRSHNNRSGCTSNGVPDSSAVLNPWGVGDGTNAFSQNIFHTDPYYDLVVYVKRDYSANDKYPNSGSAWYGISTKDNNASHYVTSDLGNGKRKTIPVYTVDWTTSGNLKYWHINDAYVNGNTNIAAHDTLVDVVNGGPKTYEDYNNGYISFCKDKNSKFIVARYFTDGNEGNYAKTIDLTSDTVSGMTFVTIGHEAFGGKLARGYYFVLPTSVTKIEERAFYRSDSSRGVRIVTFKNNGTIQTYAGSSKTFSELVTQINGQSESARTGYCCLSNSLTRVERAAFYHNFFGSVELGTALSFIGNGAFYANNNNARNKSFLFTDYNNETQNDSNDKFVVYNNGIYHKNKNMLLHQANGITGDLTLRSGTTKVGYRSATASSYSSVTFDSATTSIYGQAFKNCPNLTTLNNTGSIKYISTSDDYSASDNDYDRDDGRENTNDSSSFEGCANLKVDFSQMSSLIKIGTTAFKGCTNIVTDLSLTRSYTFKIYTRDTNNPGSGSTDDATYANSKIMDLSALKNLTNLSTCAFQDCSIDYVITPNTTGENYQTASKLTCGTEIFKNANPRVLCGETAQQADQSGTSSYKPTTHYPNTSLRPTASDYSKLYYRVHSSDDLVTANTERRYWTAITMTNTNEIKIILFESKADASDWLSVTANVNSQRHIL